MYLTKRRLGSLLVTSLLACVSSASHAIDSFGVEYGKGDEVKMARLNAQWTWKSQWWRSNGTHIGGYWNVNLDRWQENRYQNVAGRRGYVTVLGITPVFRFQNDNLFGFYAEAGIGANYLSEHYDNDDSKLSTKFQFGDHIGIGYVFSNKLDLGLKYQHFSNGGIKKPNSGVNFTVIGLKYRF